MTTDKKIIMYDSPEAASQQTVTGWVASNGQFWGKDEHMARYVGSTHKQCDKNPEHPIYEKSAYCTACRVERKRDTFATMERKPWDGTTPLVVYDGDRYFFDADDLADWLVDNEVKPADAQLVFCKPNMAHEITSETWCDDIPEDGEVSARLEDALEELNKIIRTEPPLSWSQGNVVATLPDDFLDAQS